MVNVFSFGWSCIAKCHYNPTKPKKLPGGLDSKIKDMRQSYMIK